jgi:hypothetical protein
MCKERMINRDLSCVGVGSGMFLQRLHFLDFVQNLLPFMFEIKWPTPVATSAHPSTEAVFPVPAQTRMFLQVAAGSGENFDWGGEFRGQA